MNRDAGIFAAVVGVSAMVTAGFGWLTVLIGWCIGTVIFLLLPERRNGNMGKLSAAVVLVGGILVLAAGALGAEDAFPEDTTFPFISAAMLLLIWRSLCGERNTGAAVANLMGLVLLPMVGVVLLFGLRDVRWTENLPMGEAWGQIPVVVAATSLWWCFHRGEMEKRSWFWYAFSGLFSLGMSLLTHGILGRGLAAVEPFPMYRAVQTIRILGVLQRMEALFAAAVLMGAFCVMALVGGQVRTALDVLMPETKARWKCGAALLAAFGVEMGIKLAGNGIGGEIRGVFWVLIPILALWMVFLGKTEKIQENP